MIPEKHAERSVKRWGGRISDYIPIHQFMDSSKACVSDNRHRILTHNSWFLVNVLPKSFGDLIVDGDQLIRSEMLTNSDGVKVPVKDIGEWHCIEDFGFIPTPQDYIENLDLQDWMSGKGRPKRIKNRNIEKKPID